MYNRQNERRHDARRKDVQAAKDFLTRNAEHRYHERRKA
jgi:hypothetical protein